MSILQGFRNEFYKCPKHQLAQNVCAQMDPLEASISRSRFQTQQQHVVEHKLEEMKPIVDQKTSGRCWNFAALNTIRIPCMKEWNIEEFEFSQSYMFYWDKIERSYFFLNNIIDAHKRGEEVNGRLVSYLLSNPVGEGGRWGLVVSLIKKHGMIPKLCFPESFSSESSAQMNKILNSKLREFAKQIHEMFAAQSSDVKIQSKVDEQMHDIYNIVGICLGIPPVTFTWEYYDKDKKYHSVGPVTPMEFYDKHVKPWFNVDDKVCIHSDPRPTLEFGKGYTVDCRGNVVGGTPVFFNNQPIDVLIDLVTKSIQSGEGVWFGCDVSARFARYQGGIEDLDMCVN